MGYMHINNLYKEQDILIFKECYVLEKIHGTSAQLFIVVSDNGVPSLMFNGGGVAHQTFIRLFDSDDIIERFKKEVNRGESITVYGEAYGGSQQGMSHTYGDKLRFVAFDVKVGDTWLSVPQAEDVVNKLGLEFVWYVRSDTDVEKLNALRDRYSEQAKRNGITEPKFMEGVVIRPLIELTKNNGSRIIVKHKREEFKETKTAREVSPEQLAILTEANQVADEWVTAMRLEHVLDKLTLPALDMKFTGQVIKAMIEDVKRESDGEVVWSKEVEKAVGAAASKIYKIKVSALTETKVLV
jgi:hypothetical protein